MPRPVTEEVIVASTNFVNTMGGGGKEGMLEFSHVGSKSSQILGSRVVILPQHLGGVDESSESGCRKENQR